MHWFEWQSNMECDKYITDKVDGKYYEKTINIQQQLFMRLSSYYKEHVEWSYKDYSKEQVQKAAVVIRNF